MHANQPSGLGAFVENPKAVLLQEDSWMPGSKPNNDLVLKLQENNLLCLFFYPFQPTWNSFVRMELDLVAWCRVVARWESLLYSPQFNNPLLHLPWIDPILRSGFLSCTTVSKSSLRLCSVDFVWNWGSMGKAWCWNTAGWRARCRGRGRLRAIARGRSR